MLPMALQSSSMVLAAAARSCALSFAKAISMGFRSGLATEIGAIDVYFTRRLGTFGFSGRALSSKSRPRCSRLVLSCRRACGGGVQPCSSTTGAFAAQKELRNLNLGGEYILLMYNELLRRTSARSVHRFRECRRRKNEIGRYSHSRSPQV